MDLQRKIEEISMKEIRLHKAIVARISTTCTIGSTNRVQLVEIGTLYVEPIVHASL